MRTTWRDDGERARGHRAALADRLRVRAGRPTCAACSRRSSSRPRAARSCCWSISATGATAWAARRWRRSTAPWGATRRTSTTRKLLTGFFAHVAGAARAGKLLAYHDRSDGGLFVTLRRWRSHRAAAWTSSSASFRRAHRRRCSTRSSAPWSRSAPQTVTTVVARVRAPRACDCVARSAQPASGDALRVRAGRSWYSMTAARRSASRLVGDDATRCRPCATTRRAPTRNTPASRDRRTTRACRRTLTFDRARGHRRRPSSPRGARPRVAILREQGVNGQVEMAAALRPRRLRRRRRAHDRSPRRPRRRSHGFKGLAACGGFSYGDVLGAGRGLGEVDPVQRAARATQFAAFFARPDTLRARRLQRLPDDAQPASELIPGAAHWPRFVRNRSEQFEARLAMVEVQRLAVAVASPAWRARGIPVAVAHGEGYAEFRDAAAAEAAEPLCRLRFVDHRGRRDRALSRTIRTARRTASPA